MIKPIKNWRLFLGIILLGLVILLIPHLINLNQSESYLLGDETYFNLNIANKIKENQFDSNIFIIQDNSAYINRQVITNPYQLLLSLLNNLELFSIIIPILFGLISLLLVYLILRRLNINKDIRFLTMVMVIFSPIFVYVFSLSTKYSMIITLMLLGYYFFLKESWYSVIFSSLSFSIVTLFGNFESILSIILLLGYVLITKNKKLRLVFVLLAIIISMIFFNTFILSNVEQTIQNDFIEINFFNEIISDFGSNVGLGLFKFLVAIIGIVLLWNKRNENIFLIIIFGFIIFSVIVYNLDYLIYASFFLSYLAALGLDYFIKRKWHVETLKYLTLITIFSGLLFSSVSYLMLLSRDNYSNETIESLIWLNENKEKGLILSHYSYGFIINHYSEMPVLMDSYFKNNIEINNYYQISNNIFNSYILRQTVEYLDQLNIRYLWITNEMKQGLVWEEESGLLFLLRNRDHFEKIYENDEIQIYKIISDV